MSYEIKDGGPAFPVIPPVDSGAMMPSGYPYPDPGMSLRDYFASKALLAIITTPKPWYEIGVGKDRISLADNAALWAYEYADAMLRARGEV